MESEPNRQEGGAAQGKTGAAAKGRHAYCGDVCGVLKVMVNHGKVEMGFHDPVYDFESSLRVLC